MAINMFEGARRFSKLVIAIWVIFFIGIFIYILVDDPSLKGFYLLIVFVSTLFGGPLFILAFTWAVGWIVRGFMGIPRGQDKKDETDNPTA